jgi:hypothetical protein
MVASRVVALKRGCIPGKPRFKRLKLMQDIGCYAPINEHQGIMQNMLNC